VKPKLEVGTILELSSTGGCGEAKEVDLGAICRWTLGPYDTQYIEARWNEHLGCLEIRCGEGVLAVVPSHSNVVYAEVRPL